MNKTKYPIISALLIVFIMLMMCVGIKGCWHKSAEIEQAPTNVEIWTKEYYLQEKQTHLAQYEEKSSQALA